MAASGDLTSILVSLGAGILLFLAVCLVSVLLLVMLGAILPGARRSDDGEESDGAGGRKD